MQKEFIFLADAYRGGAHTFMNDHMEYLIKKKQKVFLFAQNPKKTFESLNKNVVVDTLDIRNNKKNIINSFKNIIRKNDKEKIFVITNFVYLIKFYLFFRFLNKQNTRIILTLHSGILDINLKKYLIGLLFSFIYKEADHIFFGSMSAKLWWKRVYPWMNLDKSLVHFNGIKIKKKNIKKLNKSIQISFAGRIEKENDPEFFLRIAKEYLKMDNLAKFNIFGDGPLLKDLKKKYKNKNILYHGWVKKDQIYKNTNIIVITAPLNNFPYVALEAKSYGIPVVSCSKGDIKKIIYNNLDGYLEYTKSEKKMINLIKKIIKNYNKFSKNSLQKSKFFELNNACKKFWNFLYV